MRLIFVLNVNTTLDRHHHRLNISGILSRLKHKYYASLTSYYTANSRFLTSRPNYIILTRSLFHTYK